MTDAAGEDTEDEKRLGERPSSCPLSNSMDTSTLSPTAIAAEEEHPSILFVIGSDSQSTHSQDNPPSSDQHSAAVEERTASGNIRLSINAADAMGGNIEGAAAGSEAMNGASMSISSSVALEGNGESTMNIDRRNNEQVACIDGASVGASIGSTIEQPAAPSPEAIAASFDGVMDAESQALGDSNNLHIDVTAEAYAVHEDGIEPSEAKMVPTILGVEKKRFYLMAAIVVVLLAITLGTILGTFLPTINDDDGSAADQTRKPKPPTIILTPEELATKRQILVIALSPLAGQEVFNLDESTNVSAHRNEALEWLMNDIPDYASPTTESIFGYYQEWKIQQRYIMALFYFSTNGTGWIHQLEFLSELDECKWMLRTPEKIDYDQIDRTIPRVPKGLACNSNGKMMSIDFKMNKLVGTIPHEVSFLSKSLKTFVLNSNKLSSTIPPSFEELKELTTMMLNDNCLTGTIPENLHKMESLEKAKVSGNSELSGNLNGFCDEDGGLRGNMEYLTTNCDNCAWVESGEVIMKCDCCDCCDCCDAAASICCSAEGIPSFNTVLGATFDESKCEYK